MTPLYVTAHTYIYPIIPSLASLYAQGRFIYLFIVYFLFISYISRPMSLCVGPPIYHPHSLLPHVILVFYHYFLLFYHPSIRSSNQCFVLFHHSSILSFIRLGRCPCVLVLRSLHKKAVVGVYVSCSIAPSHRSGIFDQRG